jgi:hypothetical protein
MSCIHRAAHGRRDAVGVATRRHGDGRHKQSRRHVARNPSCRPWRTFLWLPESRALIIAIDGDDTPPDGDDGVVTYASAHVDYWNRNSCPPTAIPARAIRWSSRVRRILLEHLREVRRLDRIAVRFHGGRVSCMLAVKIPKMLDGPETGEVRHECRTDQA